MSLCGRKALTLLSSVFAVCALGLLGIAVSTDYWLYLEEGVILPLNQTTEIRMSLHSGLWRVCFLAGKLDSKTCQTQHNIGHRTLKPIISIGLCGAPTFCRPAIATPLSKFNSMEPPHLQEPSCEHSLCLKTTLNPIFPSSLKARQTGIISFHSGTFLYPERPI